MATTLQPPAAARKLMEAAEKAGHDVEAREIRIAGSDGNEDEPGYEVQVFCALPGGMLILDCTWSAWGDSNRMRAWSPSAKYVRPDLESPIEEQYYLHMATLKSVATAMWAVQHDPKATEKWILGWTHAQVRGPLSLAILRLMQTM